MLTKLRFIEAGAANRYRKTWTNHFVYNTSICNPSTGLITLATLAKRLVDDTLMYSESISEVVWEDVNDADVVFISINTFNALRGYEIADRLRQLESRPLVVLGGMHASLNYTEAVHHADYVLLGDADESIVEFVELLQSVSAINLPEQSVLAIGLPEQNVSTNYLPEQSAPAVSLPVQNAPAVSLPEQRAESSHAATNASPALKSIQPPRPNAQSPHTATNTFLWPAGGAQVQIAGLAYLGKTSTGESSVITTAERSQPCSIDTIPDRSLVYDYARMAKSYDTLWPQVHASRGCTGTCDYCCVIAHFGRKVRTRSPESVVEDIRQAIAFHNRSMPPRLNRAVWLTDDNFALNRSWAKEVLQAIIDSDISWPITVQARWELGFDDEMLSLMKQANFFEVSLGIEFIDDASFVRYHKRCTRERIEQAIANIQAHGIGVRGLFILGSEEDTAGVGRRLGQFIADNNIHGCLIQSMFFVPGTPVYEQNKDSLLHHNWDLFNGNVVHYPKNMTPAELQQEMIDASATAYSPRRLLHALLHAKGIFKLLFIGESFWHASLRRAWRKRLPELEASGQKVKCETPVQESAACVRTPSAIGLVRQIGLSRTILHYCLSLLV